MADKKTTTSPKKPPNTVKPIPIVEPARPDHGSGYLRPRPPKPPPTPAKPKSGEN